MGLRDGLFPRAGGCFPTITGPFFVPGLAGRWRVKLRAWFALRLFAGLLIAGSGVHSHAGGHPPTAPLPGNPTESSGLWQPFLTVRAGTGYRSNPLLGNAALGTAFGSAGADLFLLRLPTDNTTFTAFFNAEDIRYFTTLRPATNEPGASQERTFLTAVRVGHSFGQATNWTLKFEGRHLYNDQYLNTSSFDSLSTNLSSLRAVTHIGTIIPSVAWQVAEPWRLELGVIGTRQIYLNADANTGLSSTWETGPRLTSAFQTRRLGSLELEFTGIHREFDDRVQSSALGLPLADTRLRQDDLRAELTWRRNWGAARAWQTTWRTFYVWRRENGEGYTDYDRLGLVGTVGYQATHWSARVTGRWSTYDYPRSCVVYSGVLAVPRERETVQAEARLEYKLSSKVRMYLEYQWDREQANRLSDNYAAHVGTLGMEYDF